MLTIQDGSYSINIALISEICWESPDEATVTMVTGNEFTIEGEDLEALKKALA